MKSASSTLPDGLDRQAGVLHPLTHAMPAFARYRGRQRRKPRRPTGEERRIETFRFELRLRVGRRGGVRAFAARETVFNTTQARPVPETGSGCARSREQRRKPRLGLKELPCRVEWVGGGAGWAERRAVHLFGRKGGGQTRSRAAEGAPYGAISPRGGIRICVVSVRAFSSTLRAPTSGLGLPRRPPLLAGRSTITNMSTDDPFDIYDPWPAAATTTVSSITAKKSRPSPIVPLICLGRAATHAFTDPRRSEGRRRRAARRAARKSRE